MGEKTIFDSLHPDANSLFNTCSDIKRVCWQLYDPHKHLKHEVSRSRFAAPLVR